MAAVCEIVDFETNVNRHPCACLGFLLDAAESAATERGQVDFAVEAHRQVTG